MQTIIMYNTSHVYNKGTKAEYTQIASWEIFIDTPSLNKCLFGCVTSKVYVTRPTKRQIRQLKKEHRLNMMRESKIDYSTW